jgi:hypothetical protein
MNRRHAAGGRVDHGVGGGATSRQILIVGNFMGVGRLPRVDGRRPDGDMSVTSYRKIMSVWCLEGGEPGMEAVCQRLTDFVSSEPLLLASDTIDVDQNGPPVPMDEIDHGIGGLFQL